VAGVVLGFASPTPAPAQAAPPVETTVAPTTTTLPADFHTVILGSYNDRGNAEARLRQVLGMGVKDAGIIDQAQYDLSTAFAVYSGRYKNQYEARAHLQELAQYGIPPSGRFYKHVTRRD
jgi:hypothetical protein